MADKKELNLEELENVAGGAYLLARNPHEEPDAEKSKTKVLYENEKEGIKITEFKGNPNPSDDTEYITKQPQPQTQTQPFHIDRIVSRK